MSCRSWILMCGLCCGSLAALAGEHSSSWFDAARYGVFIHYGAYAVAARGEWVKNREKISKEEYTESYCRKFKAEKLDCRDWARKFKAWGFAYGVLTVRHHDGYAMWNSKVNPYNCVAVGGAPDDV